MQKGDAASIVEFARVRPVEVEFVEFKAMNDLMEIANWIGSVVEINTNARLGMAQVTMIREVPFGQQEEITFGFNDRIVKDLDRRFRVYKLGEFQKYFTRDDE